MAAVRFPMYEGAYIEKLILEKKNVNQSKFIINFFGADVKYCRR